MYSVKKNLRKTIFVFLILMGILYLLTYVVNKENLENFKTILGVISFIYGFFVASIFSFLRNKYFTFKTKFAEINGHLIALHQIALLTGQKKYINNLKKAIFEFIECLRKLKPEKYPKNQELFYNIFQQVKYLKVTSKTDQNYHARTLLVLSNLSKAREINEVHGNKYLIAGLKFIFVLITMIFLFSAMYFTALTGAYIYITPLLFAVVFLTFLLFDIDSFRYGAHAIRYRNLRQLRDMLK